MVKAISIVTLALSLAVPRAKAQDSTHTDGAKPIDKPLERYEYVIGSCLAFSLVDYLGYNILVKSNPYSTGKINALHVLDVTLGGAINYFLYKTCGLSSALSFDLIWWTWGLDLGFSGWGDVINPPSPWVNRANSSLHSAAVYWAGWTPVGILRAPKSNIALSTLYAQAIVGFSVSMAIIW
jgi:hypothetical protein